MIDLEIKKLFSQAYILGGSPCSGKSTIAERLAGEFSFQYFKVDDYQSEHSNRSDPNRHLLLTKYSKMGLKNPLLL